ncbi:hypothetical protein ADK74_22320 [Streptomyces decoyicus]|nr:hypothetical protein ADK74_22320 [Streptomyces decoyicus]
MKRAHLKLTGAIAVAEGLTTRGDVAAESQGFAAQRAGQHAYGPVARVDTQQTSLCVAHQQLTIHGGLQAEQSSTGVGNGIRPDGSGTRECQLPDRSVCGPGEEPALDVGHHVFGP